jgi:cytoskeletal protein CcmA (bactofilin family)
MNRIMAKEVANSIGTAVYSLLASGTKVIGNVTTENDIRIDGHVEGDIVCQGKIIMGPQSYVKGSIHCLNAEIIGIVDGNVTVQDALIMRQDAHITGNIQASRLVIEAGAQFNGICSMPSENQAL